MWPKARVKSGRVTTNHPCLLPIAVCLYRKEQR